MEWVFWPVIKINAPRGLGDAIHVRAIVVHLLKRNETIEVITKWEDVFADLPIKVLPYSKWTEDEDLAHATACLFCQVPFVKALSQFQNACLQAGIIETVPLDIAWKVKNRSLLNKIRSSTAKPILIYQAPKIPKNNEMRQWTPRIEAFQDFIEKHDDHYRILVGHKDFTIDNPNLPFELSLIGETSVTDVIDLATISDLIFCEPSYLGILAQAFNKNLVCMFSARAARSNLKRVRGVTPERIFHKKENATAIYDEPR